MIYLNLLLIGIILVMYGWYWGGLTENRGTAVSAMIPGAILALWVGFSGAEASVLTGLAATGAVFGLLVGTGTWWNTAADRATGLFSLLFALVGTLVTAALVDAENGLTTLSLGTLLLTVAMAFVFISAGLTPKQKGFRAFVGWLVLIVGAVLVFLAFAPALGVVL
ncbi:MAG TPA: hypothetical protein VGB28_01435 [Actinomycetota bacterium]